MQAKVTKILDFLKSANQFVVPIYQRLYSWEATHCNQLLSDIIRIGRNNSVQSHF